MNIRDALIGGGLTLGGGLLLATAIRNTVRAKQRATDAFKLATDRARKADMSKRTLNKLRRISDNDVNIGRMRDNLQQLGMKDNAFYNPNPDYKLFVEGLMADKNKGSIGTVAIGDDARALPIVAHELGHAENNRTGQLRKRVLYSALGGLIGAASTGLGFAALHDLNTFSDRYADGVLGITGGAGAGIAIGNLIANQAILNEERKASENAMRYLKELKRTQKLLKEDKGVLDTALDTYKAARTWSPLSILGASAMLGGGSYLAYKALR